MIREDSVILRTTWKDRKIVVSKNKLPGVGTYHCGYVQIKKGLWSVKPKQPKEGILEEVTYAGGVEGEEGWFFGFDTAHSYDTPHARSEKTVLKRTKKMVEELIEQGY